MRTEAECTLELSPSRAAPLVATGFWRRVSLQVFRLARAILNRIAVNRLSEMDERLLSDIGLTPHDLTRALGASIGDDPSHELTRAAVANANLRTRGLRKS